MAANTQPQSLFFKLPPEIRVSVYEYILSNFRGKNTHLLGPLSCCTQMSSELEKEMTRAMYRNLGFVIRVIQSKWNSLRCPPLRVTIPPYTTSTKHDEITLDLGLPNSAFTSSWLLNESLHRTILPRLSQFNLARLSISFFNDNTYTPGTRWLTYPGSSFEWCIIRETYHQWNSTPRVRLQQFCLDVDLGTNGDRLDCLYLWKSIKHYYQWRDGYDIYFVTDDGKSHARLDLAVEAQWRGGSFRVTCMRKDS